LLDLSVSLINAQPLQEQNADAMSAFAEVYVDPARTVDLSMGPGSTFSVNVTLTNATRIGTCAFNLTYDPQVLKFVGFDILPVGGEYPRFTFTANTSIGFIWMSLYYSTPITVSSSAPLTRLRFNVNSYGISPLSLSSIELLDQYGNTMIYNELDGFFANIIRDVAVNNVVPAFNWLYQTWMDSINVTVANFGNVTESFNVTAWYNSTAIATSPVDSLVPGAQVTVSIPWNTTGVPAGNYIITGTASLVPYETYFNTTNNVYVDGVVQVLNYAEIRDVAITNVTTASYWATSWAYQGAIMNITVSASNIGTVPESFNVMAFCDSNVVGNVSVTLAPGSGVSQLFSLNTTGLAIYVNHTISGQASIVPYEFNTSNNIFMDGNVTIRFLGDVNGDGKVDGRDITLISKAFGAFGPGFLYPGSPPSSNWDIRCDLNADNKIDGRDITLATKNFGKSI